MEITSTKIKILNCTKTLYGIIAKDEQEDNVRVVVSKKSGIKTDIKITMRNQEVVETEFAYAQWRNPGFYHFYIRNPKGIRGIEREFTERFMNKLSVDCEDAFKDLSLEMVPALDSAKMYFVTSNNLTVQYTVRMKFETKGEIEGTAREKKAQIAKLAEPILLKLRSQVFNLGKGIHSERLFVKGNEIETFLAETVKRMNPEITELTFQLKPIKYTLKVTTSFAEFCSDDDLQYYLLLLNQVGAELFNNKNSRHFYEQFTISKIP